MSGIPAGAGSLLGKRLGKYEILALLALGGTAEIYLARIGGAAGFEKYVVVKCLHDHLADDAEFVKMFLDEARLAAHLDHSNIVQTMELGEHENRYYMVMEFLAGLSLAMIVRRAGERLQGGKIPVPLVLNLLAQACAGLHYAHEKAMNGKPLNIVHRDISPQNLVVSFEGVVKVVDFGIAKAELRETRTRSGTIKGKFAYMSPEQCVANNVDRRTDVFALGVIGHELLTGRRLFKKPSPYETYQAVIECSVEPPSKLNVEVDPAIDPILLKAVAKDKEQRYPTAEAFGDALLGYLHHRGKGSGPGDVARFFEASFGQEIDEHGARMRELISGREIAAELNWGGEDDDAKRNQTVDLGAKAEKSVSLDSIDLVEVDRDSAPLRGAARPGAAGAFDPHARGASGAAGAFDPHARGASGAAGAFDRPSSGSLSDVIDELGTGRGDEDDDMPAEKTRIETNPLERVEELNKVGFVGKQKTPPPALIPTQIAPNNPPPAKPVMPPSGPLPLPAPPTGPMPASGGAGANKFLANLPTMIAESDDDDSDEDPAIAKTALSKETYPQVDPHAPTSMNMEPVDTSRPTANGVPAQRPNPGSQPMPMPRPPQTTPARTSPPPSQAPRPGPSQQPPVGNLGYPVLNAQLSAQIATGATVFPSESPARGVPQQPPPPQHAHPQHAGQPPPYAPQYAPPMGTPGGQPPMIESGPYPQVQNLADLASPVGPQYGQHVDWAAAAAQPAKALPPWKLIVLFVGALGIALLITILIAKAAR